MRRYSVRAYDVRKGWEFECQICACPVDAGERYDDDSGKRQQGFEIVSKGETFDSGFCSRYCATQGVETIRAEDAEYDERYTKRRKREDDMHARKMAGPTNPFMSGIPW